MKKLTSLNSDLFQPLCNESMSYIRGGRMDCTYSVSRTQTEKEFSCNGDTNTVTKDDDGKTISSGETDNPCPNTPA